MDKLIGQQIGRYKLIEPIARGGMALVFKAQDSHLDRIVAFKLLLPGYHHTDTFIKRFEREAKTLAQLAHPNIVPILDYGEFQGNPFLVMTYLPGGSLKEQLGAPFPVAQATLLLRPIADALEYAHQRGMIHRDIKPANILLTENRQPMLSDFGIVKLLESKGTENLTETGLGIGTPDYMSPEQAHGYPVDPRTDVYSLGIVLYEMVTGRKPFEADTPMSLLFKHVSEPVPPPRSILPTLSEETEKVILKALAKDREKRYKNMAEFKQALLELENFKEDRARVILPVEPTTDATEIDAELWEIPPDQPVPAAEFEAQTDVSLTTEDIEEDEAEIKDTEVKAGPATEVATSAYIHDLSAAVTVVDDGYGPQDGTRAVIEEQPDAEVTSVVLQKPGEKEKKRRWLIPVLISLAVVAALTLIAIFVIIPAIDQGKEETTSPPVVEVEAPESTEMEQSTQVETVAEEPEEEQVAPPVEEQMLTVVRLWPPTSLDPSFSYQLESWEILGNVYETLVFYPRHNPNEFIPQLSDGFGPSPDGGTYGFHIRDGIRFHNGSLLTAGDAAYTFQRAILTGTESTPQWMLTEAILGPWKRDITLLIDPEGGLIGNREMLVRQDPDALFNACMLVKEHVYANEDEGIVTFHLAQPWSPFLRLIAAPFSSVIDQEWAIEMGDWDGSCETWQHYYAQPPQESNLSRSTNGTGPFKLDHWEMDPGFIRLIRNDSYWREEPMWETGPSGNALFSSINLEYLPEPITRIEYLHSGEADLIEVNRYVSFAEADEVGQVCVEESVSGQYECENLSDDPMRLLLGNKPRGQTPLTFNHEIHTVEGEYPFIGSGRLDGEGVPPNFFSDVHIRIAFQACFNWGEFNELVYRGDGIHNPTLALPGMLGFNPETPFYNFNLEECAAQFQESEWVSPDGQSLWEVGFHLQLPFHANIHSTRIAMELLAVYINEVNPSFRVEPLELNGEDYWFFYDQKALPIAMRGRFEDVYDPHYRYAYFLVEYNADMMSFPMETREAFNELLNEGAQRMEYETRNEVYQVINQMVFEQALFIHLGAEREHNYSNRRLTDYFYNPAYYGDYFYALRLE